MSALSRSVVDGQKPDGVRAPGTYKEACEEACKWCAEGNQRSTGGEHLVDITFASVESCTAPTPEQFMEQQAAEIERLLSIFTDSRPLAIQVSKQAARISELKAELAEEKAHRENDLGHLERVNKLCRDARSERDEAKTRIAVLERENEYLKSFGDRRVDILNSHIAEERKQATRIAELEAYLKEQVDTVALENHLQAVEKHRDEQAALIEELAKDKARLDWLAVTDDIAGMELVLASEPARNPSIEDRKRIWREAIDAATAKAEGRNPQGAATPGPRETHEIPAITEEANN